jgi:Cdc6-like AAA superfamily ATPase
MSFNKTFRLFLSSTFNDMRAERDILQETVFPKLRSYCERHGFTFQPIDLRWGVSNEAGNDQKTMQICLDEVRRCKQALNPHFAIILGDRYGWIPLPASVEAEEFELVKSAILRCYDVDSKEVNYLNLWYRRNDNNVPAEYKLQPKVTSEHQSWEYWSDVEATLREAFKSVVNNELQDLLSDAQKFKYLASATEQEIIEGLFKNHDIAKANIFFFNRQFNNLEQLTPADIARLEENDKAYNNKIEEYNLAYPENKNPAYGITIKHFSDFDHDQLDDSIRASHVNLIERIKANLPVNNTKTYSITLDPTLSRTQDAVTEAYLQQFSEDFYNTIFASMKSEIESFLEADTQLRELNAQYEFLAEKSRIFVGRESFLQKISDYISSETTNSPLIITADSGSGKSALMAKSIQNLLEQQPNNMRILFRFVGTSQYSNTPINLYRSLYHQLMQDESVHLLRDTYFAENEFTLDQVLSDINELSKLLAVIFESYPADKKLVLFIDALDQFVFNDPLDWLPRSLSHHCKIIISTLPDTYQGIHYLPKLKRKFPHHDDMILFLTPFDVSEAKAMIHSSLKAQNRSLTLNQQQILLDAFSQSGSPLYLKIILEEASQWDSYTDVSKEAYPEALDDLIARLFNRLHTHSHHSLSLINFAFAYIACSKDGLPETELFDILSHEASIMDDISNEFYPKPTRLPTAIWARLYAQMSHYITIKEIDGMDQYSFFHRKFNEGAYKLLGSRENAHRRLAHYYQAVYDQTHEFDLSLSSALTELPYQLIMSGQNKRALELLTNFDFLMKKFKLNRTAEVLDDFTLAKNLGIDKLPEHELLNERFYVFNVFIQSNKHILEKGDKDWDSSKIFFQLAIEHADNSPLTNEAEAYERDGKVTFDYVRDVNRDNEMYIAPPSIKLEGHIDTVYDVIKLRDGRLLSWSKDKTLRLWSCDAEPIAVMEGHIGDVKGAIELRDGRLLSWSEDKTLRLWSCDAEPIAVMEGHIGDVKGVNELKDGRLFSWSEDQTIRLWSCQGDVITVLAGHEYYIDNAIELSSGRIISWQSGKNLRLMTREGYVIAQLAGHKSSVRGARELSNGRILSWSRDNTLRLWDHDANAIAVLEGHEKKVISALELRDGRILSWSEDNTLRIWSGDGGAIAVLAGHVEKITKVLELRDGRILSCSWDKTLRLWDCDGKTTAVLSEHEGEVTGVLELSDGRIISWSVDRTLRWWSKEGQYLAVFEDEGVIQGILELNDGRLMSRYNRYHYGIIRILDDEIKYAKKNGYLSPIKNSRVLTTSDAVISPGIIWKKRKEKVFFNPNNSNYDIKTIEFKNRTFLFWCAVWELWNDSGKFLSLLLGHEDDVTGFRELTDDRILSWSRDKTLRLWSANGELIAILEGHDETVRNVIELSNGRILSWSFEELRLWDFHGDIIAVLDHEWGVIGAKEISDGRILSWASDKTIKLWNSNGEQIALLAGHEDEISRALELSDGRILSCSKDKTLRLWRSDGELIAILAGHEDTYIRAKELTDGKILSWSSDKSIKLWTSHGALIVTLPTSSGVDSVIELPDGKILSWTNTNIEIWSQDGSLTESFDKDKLGQMVKQTDFYHYTDWGFCNYQNMAVYEMSDRVYFSNDSREHLRWYSILLKPSIIGNFQESVVVNSDNKIRFLEVVRPNT